MHNHSEEEPSERITQTANENFLNEDDPMVSQAAAAATQGKKKLLGLALAVTLFIILGHYTPLRAWMLNVQAWKSYIRDVGPLAHVGFVFACAVAVMAGIPRLPLCGMAGLAFGFSKGLILSLSGSVLGSYLVFLLTRVGFKNTKIHKAKESRWLKELLAKPTLMRVFWMRQLMLPGVALNVLLGISGVSHHLFLLGTLIGYLPLNVTMTLVGSGLGKNALTESVTQILLAVGLINIGAWIIWRRKAARKIEKS